MSQDTAGHQIMKGEKISAERKKSLEALELAKNQQAARKGKFVWSQERLANIFITEK
jgi:hypothetical protein